MSATEAEFDTEPVPSFVPRPARRPGAVRAPQLTAADRQIINHIRPSHAIEHLTHLTENIGQRYTGTPQEKEAADYLAATLERATGTTWTSSPSRSRTVASAR